MFSEDSPGCVADTGTVGGAFCGDGAVKPMDRPTTAAAVAIMRAPPASASGTQGIGVVESTSLMVSVSRSGGGGGSVKPNIVELAAVAGGGSFDWGAGAGV